MNNELGTSMVISGGSVWKHLEAVGFFFTGYGVVSFALSGVAECRLNLTARTIIFTVNFFFLFSTYFLLWSTLGYGPKRRN